LKREPKIRGRLLCGLGAALLLTLPPPLVAQRGAVTAPLNLEQLVARAETIVHGHVAAVHAEKHPDFRRLRSLVITVKVDDAWKGEAGSTLTFRQFIWDIRDSHSLAGYREGQEVLLLLSATSRVGFRSPIGLEQGRFRVLRVNGEALALNGAGNAMLFAGMESRLEEMQGAPQQLQSLVAGHRQGPVALQDLKALVLRLAGGAP
jgi:hypothetical protein